MAIITQELFLRFVLSVPDKGPNVTGPSAFPCQMG